MSARRITKESSIYLPNTDDRRTLRNLAKALAQYTNRDRDMDKQFDDMAAQRNFPLAMLKIPGEEDRPLTPELAQVLLQAADQLSRGRAVFVAPCDTQLTTQEAADLLGISRPTLIKLLEHDEIPFTTVGRHRRIRLSDVQSYASRRHESILQSFDALAHDEDPTATLDNPLIAGE